MTDDPLDFTGKRLLITGGSGDIGRAIAVAFARRGARIVFTFFSSHEGSEETIAAVKAAGSDALAVRCNLRDKDAVQEIEGPVRAHFGEVDILVSNAATGVLRPALDLTAKHWDWTMTVNARAFLELVTTFAPDMPSGGRIMALSSAGATRAIEQYGAIGASKAALESLVRHFAMELGPRGITVNALCPGVVDTQALAHFPNREQLLNVASFRTPNGRIATPQDVANVATLLASPLAAMIQGQTVVVDGGYSILA
jgi:enoyl-[acyl-carrier protein] reductase III